MAICSVCGKSLTLEYIDEDESNMIEGEGKLKHYVCGHCGTMYDVEAFEEDNDVKNEWHGYDGKRTECGHYLIISNNFMRSEVVGDVDEEDVDEYGFANDDVICDTCFCPHCGSYLTLIPVKPSEKTKFRFL